MAKTLNILVWPGLTELGYEIMASLNPLRFYKVFTASSKDVTLESKLSDEHVFLPNVTDPGALEALQDVVRTHKIDAIYPAHDDVIVFITRHQAALGDCMLIAPSAEIAEVTRSKRATYAAVKNDIPTPQSFDRLDDILEYPVFSKPDQGQGSQGVQRFDSQAVLAAASADDADFFVRNIVCEYLPGKEYTVDCLSDASGQVLFVGPRMRHQIRNGISTDAELEDVPGIREMADRIGVRLGLSGAWFFQVKLATDGQLKLLEVAPRLGGASCLNRMRGVNFAHLSILAAQGKPFSVAPNDLPSRIQRRLANFPVHACPNVDVLFVDYDDCLVMDGVVNARLCAILFSQLNKGARLVLVSRHDGDLAAQLDKYRLAAVFDHVDHITDADVPKSKVIADHITQHPHAEEGTYFFIDDSFKERQDVGALGHVQCLDLSMLNILE